MTGQGSGTMPWPQALAGPLAGVTCLWQDLDGLHVEPAPELPPPTSILWGWRGHDYLVRARLDGGTAFIAVHDTPDAEARGSSGLAAILTLPWSVDDGRVAASSGRGPSASDGGVGAKYEQIVVGGIEDGTGPITFLRPASPDAGLPGSGMSEGDTAVREQGRPLDPSSGIASCAR